jgi:uncharacterized protein (TIGR02145 family)
VGGVSITGVSPASTTLSGAGSSQLVTYTLSGTPTGPGALNAAVDIAGILTCNTSVTVISASDGVLVQIGNEADDPDDVNSVVTVAQLNVITPALTNVEPGNETAYQDYIDANPNDFSSPATQPEVQAMITAVNTSQTVLAQIGTEADDPDAVPSVVTVAQLNTITPALTGVTAGNETAYQEYIDANPADFSSPATQAEVQAMITAVNVNQTVLAQIGNESDDPDVVNSEVTVVQLNTITPALTGVDPANETAYQDYIDANPNDFSSPATVAEVQAMIDVVNNANPPIPASIILAQDQDHFITSIYDQDYLPYTAPTGAAVTTAVAADGSNEATSIDVQGAITTGGVTISIPVTATGSGTLPYYSSTITIPAGLTEDGTSRDVTLSWAEQAYTASTTSIIATLAAVGGDVNVKKLDLNGGIGNDNLGVLLGSFTYPYNDTGDNTTLEVRGIAGIPDRMFGLADNTGSTTSHMMLYLPIVAEDGNIWLNNNLGANYANINHESFNPAQQATSATDHRAYGSLIQWGRKPDGHELILAVNATTTSAVNGTSNTPDDNPAHALFIPRIHDTYDWRVNQNNSLWATEVSENNPCPEGFRVPTLTELNTLVTAAGITNSTTAASSTLKLSVAGRRSPVWSNLEGVGTDGFYWTSSTDHVYAASLKFASNSSYIGFPSVIFQTSIDWRRAMGATVRCIKD